MSNKFYTDEEAQELQKLDVFTYLYNYEPSELVKSGKRIPNGNAFLFGYL